MLSLVDLLSGKCPHSWSHDRGGSHLESEPQRYSNGLYVTVLPYKHYRAHE